MTFQNYQLILVPFIEVNVIDAKDRARQKAAVFAALFRDHRNVIVQFDSRHEAADVPPDLRVPMMIIKLDNLFPHEMDEWHLIQRASFSKVVHRCRIPWEAVYRIQVEGQEQHVWEADVPTEMKKAFGLEVLSN